MRRRTRHMARGEGSQKVNEWYIGEATVVFIFVGAFLFVCLARHIWAKNGDVCTKWMCFHKPIGSGPDKIFCKQHAPMSEKGRGG